ncbi:hypothetical protein [Bradyrhizobium sp. 197]|nr:hypothetical protein [Bradyrhizobium sp. 197]
MSNGRCRMHGGLQALPRATETPLSTAVTAQTRLHADAKFRGCLPQ